MNRTYLCVLATGLTCGASAGAKPPLEKSGPGVRIDPIKIAKVKRVNGQIVLDGDWIPYAGGFDTRGPMVAAPFFDCYGREPALAPIRSVGTNCVPSCDTQPDDGGRWYFGIAYTNPNTIEDMQDCACPPGSVIDEVDVAWNWQPAAPAPCRIILFPFEEVATSDGPVCMDPGFLTGTGGGGVVLDFGNAVPPGGFFYFARARGLGSLGALSPWTDDNGNGLADGSYQMIIASSVTSTGYTLAPGPTQPMLWGTGDVTGECRPGRNNTLSYDDIYPTDGVFDNPAECRDYLYDVCPNPLGKTVAFCYLRCRADLNNDGFVDGIDSDQFNNDFEAGSKCADLNGDCFLDGIDADLFYNLFETPC